MLVRGTLGVWFEEPSKAEAWIRRAVPSPLFVLSELWIIKCSPSLSFWIWLSSVFLRNCSLVFCLWFSFWIIVQIDVQRSFFRAAPSWIANWIPMPGATSPSVRLSVSIIFSIFFSFYLDYFVFLLTLSFSRQLSIFDKKLSTNIYENCYFTKKKLNKNKNKHWIQSSLNCI